jgi:bifunctional non-homologous end joining protein LigD
MAGTPGAALGVSPAPRPERQGASVESESVAEQVLKAREKALLEGHGWQLAVTNLDKVLWPSVDGKPHTKRDVLAYAARIWPTMERHLRDRPLTLLRFPNGIEGKKFYQKHWDPELPPYVESVVMFSDGEGGDQRFLLCNNLPTLLWLCQLADIEWHAHLARVVGEPDATDLPRTFTGSNEELAKSVLNYPDFILFDLDPYIYAGHEKKGDEPQPNLAGFAQTSDVALPLKQILDSLGLSSFVKTSGATGLHIYVPILRQLDYGVIRAAANTICSALLAQRPQDVTMEWDTRKRTGKVFLDANQNARHKNLACAYSPRAKPGAPVSMPLRWDEVGKVKAADFTLDTVPALVAARGDAWANIYDHKQDLHKLLGL